MVDYEKRESDQDTEKIKKQLQMTFINQQFKDYKIKRIKDYQDRVVEGKIIKLQS